MNKEEKECDLLSNKPFTFTIEYQQRFLWSWVTKRQTFEVHPPTLGTLDNISGLSATLELDEERVKKEGIESVNEAYNSLVKNSRKMARILAFAVVGDKYYCDYAIVPKTRLKIRRRRDSEVDALEELFHKCITPAQLTEMVERILAMSGLGDFMNAIRLLRMTRTTAPNLIADVVE